MARERKEPRGLVVVNTGDGKGKTTAALGLAVRAAGNGMRVLIIQFIKGRWKTGESQSLPKLEPNIQLVRMGMGFTIDRLRDQRIPMEEHEEAAARAFERAREVVLADEYEMIVLDEIIVALRLKQLDAETVLRALDEKREDLHIVLTGRGATEELIARADLVTEMKMIKHPYRAGIKAQPGIEF